nr:hypothetical protein [Tanacetum cinerariifolium]
MRRFSSSVKCRLGMGSGSLGATAAMKAARLPYCAIISSAR